MKIFAISIVKNEADVIAQSLTAASKWADKIIVIDNGSTDGTWEIVQSLKSDIIIPWKQDPTLFNDGLRSTAFNAFKHLSSPGDWWCFRLDADEFYPESPKTFLSQIPSYYGRVYKKSIDFQLTRELLEEKGSALESFNPDNYKFIKPVCWTELRFFRHTNKLNWDSNDKFTHLKAVYGKKIPVMHYQNRSAQQVKNRTQLRYELRQAQLKNNVDIFSHVPDLDWLSTIPYEKDLIPFRKEIIEDLPTQNSGKSPIRKLYRSLKNTVDVIVSMMGLE